MSSDTIEQVRGLLQSRLQELADDPEKAAPETAVRGAFGGVTAGAVKRRGRKPGRKTVKVAPPKVALFERTRRRADEQGALTAGELAGRIVKLSDEVGLDLRGNA